MSDEIDNRLGALEQAQTELRDKISETSDVLTDTLSRLAQIENKIDAINKAQQKDPEKKPAQAKPQPNATLAKLTEENRKMRLVPEDLTVEQITVHPGERLGKRKDDRKK